MERRKLVTERLEILLGPVRPAAHAAKDEEIGRPPKCLALRHCTPASVLITCQSSFKGGPCGFLSNLWNADRGWSALSEVCRRRSTRGSHARSRRTHR